jgi:AcrR family transcriptional regulator
MRAQRSDSIRTQHRLISTAEKLFAEKGVDAVSLSEVNRLAGQRNKSALHYHFGSRGGLLQALIGKHQSQLEQQRQTLIEGRDLASTDLRQLVTFFVCPLSGHLLSGEGGENYIRIMAQLAANPLSPSSPAATQNLGAATTAIMDAIVSHIPEMPEEFRKHRSHLALATVFCSLAIRPKAGAFTPEETAKLDAELVSTVVSLIELPSGGTERDRELVGACEN